MWRLSPYPVAFVETGANGKRLVEGSELPPSQEEELVLGDSKVLMSSLVSYSFEDVLEQDFDGMLVAAGVLLNLAAVFLVGVMAFGWRENFLIAVVLFMVFGVACLVELIRPSGVRYHKLTLYSRNGEPIEFTCADLEHIWELVKLLEARGISRV